MKNKRLSLIMIALTALLLTGYGCKEGPKETNTLTDLTMPSENTMEENNVEEGMMNEDKTEEYSDEEESIIIDLTGNNFAFSQTEIKVKKGTLIKINFQSEEGYHDWVIDEFNTKTERVNVEEKTSVEFIADKSGTFEYYCSVGKHRELGMIGKLIVE